MNIINFIQPQNTTNLSGMLCKLMSSTEMLADVCLTIDLPFYPQSVTWKSSQHGIITSMRSEKIVWHKQEE